MKGVAYKDEDRIERHKLARTLCRECYTCVQAMALDSGWYCEQAIMILGSIVHQYVVC